MRRTAGGVRKWLPWGNRFAESHRERSGLGGGFILATVTSRCTDFLNRLPIREGSCDEFERTREQRLTPKRMAIWPAVGHEIGPRLGKKKGRAVCKQTALPKLCRLHSKLAEVHLVRARQAKSKTSTNRSKPTALRCGSYPGHATCLERCFRGSIPPNHHIAECLPARCGHWPPSTGFRRTSHPSR